MNKPNRSGRWRATRAGSLTAVALAVVLATAGCGSSNDDDNNSATNSGGASVSTVTLGEITDLSGAASVYGIPENQGAQIAVDEINAAGGIQSLGGAQLEIKKYDSQSSPDQATPQATAAVADKVSAVFGGEISDSVLAGINVTQRAGVAWVDTGGVADEIIQKGYNTVFMPTHDNTQFGASWWDMIQAASQQLGISSPKIAIAYSDTTYGQGMYAAFTKAASGANIVTKFSYPGTTTDFSSVAARLASADADVIFDAGYPGDGLALQKLFASKFTPKAKIIAAGGSDATDVVSALKDQANGLLLLGDLTPDTKGVPESFKTFYSDYQSKYNAIPNTQAICGFIAVQFIAQALEAAKSADAADVVTALKSVQLTQDTGNIYPAPATLSFQSDNSLAEAQFFGAQVVDGKAVLVYPSDVADAQVQPYK